MSDSNKTRFEVQKILCDAVKNALTQYVGASHGFGVMEFAQASFAKADRVVLVNLVRSTRRGWQAQKYPTVSSVLYRTDEWIEEQTWQFHTILKSSSSPSATDRQSDDYAQILIAYFNGAGAEYLRDNGCSPLRISDDSLVVYTDDSELYQKRSVFTLKLIVPKELSVTQPEISTIQPDVKTVDELKEIDDDSSD